eukprot:474522-Pyramimonas_sp.AAC.1
MKFRHTPGGLSAGSKVGWALVRQVLAQCATHRSLNMLPGSLCILETKALSDSPGYCASITRSGALCILDPSFFLGSWMVSGILEKGTNLPCLNIPSFPVRSFWLRQASPRDCVARRSEDLSQLHRSLYPREEPVL